MAYFIMRWDDGTETGVRGDHIVSWATQYYPRFKRHELNIFTTCDLNGESCFSLNSDHCDVRQAYKQMRAAMQDTANVDYAINQKKGPSEESFDEG